MMIRSFNVLLPALLLSACAGVAPDKLTTVTSGSVITLPNDIAYQFAYGFGARSEFRIVKGTYRAAFSDDKGTFYKGPSYCFRNKMLRGGMQKEELVDKVIEVTDCGLYLPSDPQRVPAVYIVMGASVAIPYGHTLEQIDAAIAKAAQLETSTLATHANSGATNSIISHAVTNTSLTPGQAGIAGGIAGGVVAALVEAEKGRFFILQKQPDPAQMKDLVPKPEQAQ